MAAGQIVQGTGFGLIGDLIIGVAGAFIGGWLLPQLHIQVGSGTISAVSNATIGALMLLLILRLVRAEMDGEQDWEGAGIDTGRQGTGVSLFASLDRS